MSRPCQQPSKHRQGRHLSSSSCSSCTSRPQQGPRL
jgi:hypothetical protein